MQNFTPLFIDVYKNCTENQLSELTFPLIKGERYAFIGDLGSGKSTFIRNIIRSALMDPTLVIRSPTYTYYQKYGENIYHFDLYRIDSETDLELLGITEILDNPETVCLIEWPEILPNFLPNKKISLQVTGNDKRDIQIESI